MKAANTRTTSVSSAATSDAKTTPSGKPASTDKPASSASPEQSKPGQSKPDQPKQNQPARGDVVVKKRGGFFPMLLGGIAAGGIGYGVATYQHQQASMADTSELSARIDDLTQKVGAITPVDLGGVESVQSELSKKIDTLSQQLSGAETKLGDTETKIGKLDEQIKAIEANPNGAVLPKDAVDMARAAIETDLEGLKSQVAELAEEAKQRAAEAAQRKDAAETAERTATIRGALAQMNVAVETGAPFEQEIATLTQNGVTVDPALQKLAKDGVPTKSQLVDMFPDAARQALAAARDTGADASEDKSVLSFFKAQLGARSLEPQEGNSPDAILSRAEADVRAGDLKKALTETDALPDPAKQPLATWRETVQTRLNALAALQTLNETEN